MKIETIRKLLIESDNFYLTDDEKFNNDLYYNDMEMWMNKDRILILKEYETYTAFNRWLEDQSVITELYRKIPTNYKNNLYFFMILDFSKLEMELKSEINLIERNSKVCRKYIFNEDKDLEKIPFLIDRLSKEVDFNYEEEFKKRVDIFTNNKVSQTNKNRLKKIIDIFFIEEHIEDNDIKYKTLEVLEAGIQNEN
ncbi:hypothetical protein CN270_09310 [Priestia megaterium]|uniref:ABC-three component system middle component 1 n=1 Tax=Priestia megaterium TaxID=1404 RepID=UPI000BFAA19D|nr:ABC-three component system middle component 1 [Priestia megaterium]PFE34882.1 hypothetical protein CN270_09310 [Priestia megaterium]